MLNIKKQLYSDIEAYCKLNDITDVNKYCNDLLEKAFVSEKYGNVPQIIPTKIVEKKPEPPVYNPENSLSLQNEEPKPIITQPEQPKKVFKKFDLNDDYKTYDF